MLLEEERGGQREHSKPRGVMDDGSRVCGHRMGLTWP